MKPYHGQIAFCFTAENQGEAERTWERIDEAVRGVTGLPTEGGELEPMERSDVVPDSPLDHALGAAS